MSAIAPADVLWFGLPQKEDAQLDTTALDVRCDDLDHPSFVLEDKTGRGTPTSRSASADSTTS